MLVGRTAACHPARPVEISLNGVTHDGTPDGNKPLTGDDAVFLSNLSPDSGETKNLRTDHPEITDQLQTLVHQWRQEVEKNYGGRHL